MRVWLRHKRHRQLCVSAACAARGGARRLRLPAASTARRRRPHRRSRGRRRSARSPSRCPGPGARPRSTNRGRHWCPRDGRCRCGRACPKPGWLPGHPTARCWFRCRAPGRYCGLQPTAIGPRESMLLDGLDQPHGLAFAGPRSMSPKATRSTPTTTPTAQPTNPRTVAGGLPDAKSPDLRGAYAHALKSVAVGPDGAVYFSIGSTGNISAERPRRRPAARDDHAGPARRWAGCSRSQRAYATAPDWRSRPTARCGRRSTTATTSRSPTDRRRPGACPTTSTTIRPSLSPG